MQEGYRPRHLLSPLMPAPPSPPTDGDPAGPDPAENPLARWLAEARSDVERSARHRAAWLSQRDQEAASFVGTLVDLADAGIDVTLETVARRVGGRLTGVGVDVVVLRDGPRWVAVPLGSLEAVRHAGSPRSTGDRQAPDDATLLDLLDALAAEQERVGITSRSGNRVVGRILSAGADVVTVAADGEARPTVVVAIDAINDVALS
jgi:hypothetical protein